MLPGIRFGWNSFSEQTPISDSHSVREHLESLDWLHKYLVLTGKCLEHFYQLGAVCCGSPKAVTCIPGLSSTHQLLFTKSVKTCGTDVLLLL